MSKNPQANLIHAIANEGLHSDAVYSDAVRLVETLASDPHSGGVGRGLVAHLRSLSQH